MSITTERITKLRKRKSLTQQDLADNINTSRVTITRIENGARNPSYAMLSLIADALDTTVEYLYGYTDDAYKTSQNGPENKGGIVALENSELALTLDGKVLPDEYRELFISFVRVLRKERDD